jgi:hypothetical protein
MPTIKISEEVYGEIAKRGKFGETVDDVLRREFGMVVSAQPRRQGRVKHAVRRMTPTVKGDGSGRVLEIEFHGGATNRFPLPPVEEQGSFRPVLEQALQWAKSEGASRGQLHYIRKVCNEAGYYLIGRRGRRR